MSGSLSSLISSDTKIKVSSTLDKSVGKKYLIDRNPETCWTSQQGIPQHIHLEFPVHVIPKRISFTFQGGFVGTNCAVCVPETDTTGWRIITRVFPEDVNRRQNFELRDGNGLGDFGSTGGGRVLKLLFEESSDFFGRITIYDLDIEGVVVDKDPLS